MRYFNQRKSIMASGVIFDLKKYAIHDGPGIRTTIFFKGCPLACRWCHNPEGMTVAVQRIYRQERCIGCGECIQICPRKAIRRTAEGIIADLSKCELCRACADHCPSEAVEFVGQKVTVAEVVRQIEKDVAFYDQSKGGVTFSGGEPLMQPEFLLEMLDACGNLDLHRTVDTTGYADATLLLKVAQKTDLFLYDLKLMDAEKHRSYTGVSNEQILDNLTQLAQNEARIQVRLPVIPGINSDVENIDKTADFIHSLGRVENISLLPLHNSARGKYSRLGMQWISAPIAPPGAGMLQSIAARLKKTGLKVTIGG
jgi:pyruvate formate lyase activating enzyme